MIPSGHAAGISTLSARCAGSDCAQSEICPSQSKIDCYQTAEPTYWLHDFALLTRSSRLPVRVDANPRYSAARLTPQPKGNRINAENAKMGRGTQSSSTTTISREAYGVRPACRRFATYLDHLYSTAPAGRTPYASRPIITTASNFDHCSASRNNYCGI